MKQRNKAVTLLLNTLKALIIPVGIWLAFVILTGGKSASTKMLITTLRQTVQPTIICYGLMLNMCLGMMNFSAGGMMLFAGIIGGTLAKMTGTGAFGLVLFCLLVCVAEGAVNGLLYNLMRVPCIVLTIGMMLVWESFPKAIVPNGLNISSNMKMTILTRQPYCFVVLAVMAAIFYIIYNKTAFGHNMRALGSNQAIANSVGLNSDKIKLLSFVLGSVFLGIGAVLYVSNMGEVRNVTTMGSMTIMMDGFMGMFIAMFIARYCDMTIAIPLGSFAMKMMTNGFVAMGVSSTVRDIVQGFFLLILLVIQANSGVFERRKLDAQFKLECDEAYAKAAQAS